MVPTFPFFIVGYSTGTLTALEIARELEKEGYKGVVVLIDGAPDYLKKIVSTVFGDLEDLDSLDSNLLHAIYNLFVPGTNIKIRDELNTLKTWEDKLAYMEKVIPEQVLDRKEHQKRVTNDFRHRLTAVIKYDASKREKLSSKIILIRPVEQFLPAILPEDYNLSLVSIFILDDDTSYILYFD